MDVAITFAAHTPSRERRYPGSEGPIGVTERSTAGTGPTPVIALPSVVGTVGVRQYVRSTVDRSPIGRKPV